MCIHTKLSLSFEMSPPLWGNQFQHSSTQEDEQYEGLEQIDAVVRAPAHPPTTEHGEDGPLPQVTWRQTHWSIANPCPPVPAPGSRLWKKSSSQEEPTPSSLPHPVATGAPSMEPSSSPAPKSSVIVLRPPKDSVIVLKAPQ